MTNQGQLGDSVQRQMLRAFRDQADGRRRAVLADVDPTDVVLQGDFDMGRVGESVAEAIAEPARFEMTPELRAVLPGVDGYSSFVEVYRALLGAARFDPEPVHTPTVRPTDRMIDVHGPQWGVAA